MKNKFDILIVGAGLSSATIAAKLKKTFDICVIDTKSHIGGLCYDYKSKNSYVHMYGPHIFHSNNKNTISFISKYTELVPFYNKVEAEIYFNNKKIRVPFPYSKETTDKINKELSYKEIINIFFDTYSQKMWGKPFKELPETIRKRVPKKTIKSDYFPGEYQFIMKSGYSNMIKKMLEGTEIILNADSEQWKSIKAKKIIYCGRIDLINYSKYKILLQYKTSKIIHKIEYNNEKINVVNICNYDSQYIRKTFQKNFYNDINCQITTYELPIPVNKKNINPFYPCPTSINIKKYNLLKEKILKDYPNIIFSGRNGTYQYLNMDKTIELGLNISKYLLS